MFSSGLRQTGKESLRREFENELRKAPYQLMSEMNRMSDVFEEIVRILVTVAEESEDNERAAKIGELKKAVWGARSKGTITPRETRILEALYECIVPLTGAEDYIANENYSVRSLIMALEQVFDEVVKRINEFDGKNPMGVPPPIYEYRAVLRDMQDGIAERRRNMIQVGIETCIMRSAELCDYDTLREGIHAAAERIPNFAVTFKLKEFVTKSVQVILSAAAKDKDHDALKKAKDAVDEFRLEIHDEIEEVRNIIRTKEAKEKMEHALEEDNTNKISVELQEFFELGVKEPNLVVNAADAMRTSVLRQFESGVDECNVDDILDSVDRAVYNEVLLLGRFHKNSHEVAEVLRRKGKDDELLTTPTLHPAGSEEMNESGEGALPL